MAGSAIRLRQAKAPVKFIHMSEGALVNPVGWGIVKNAPHPSAAKVFINWLGTPAGQKALDEVEDSPLRAGTTISEPENDPKGVKLIWFETDESESSMYPSFQEAADFFDIK